MDVSGNIGPAKKRRGLKGVDYNVLAQKNLGENVTVGGNISGNTSKHPSVAAFATAKSKNSSITLSHQSVPNLGNTTTKAADVNIFNANGHSVNATTFHSSTALKNGFKFDQHGGGVNYSNQGGFSASAGVSHIPNIQSSTNISASQNIFKSPNSSLDFNVAASRVCNPTGRCNSNFGGSFNFKGSF